MSSIVSLVCWAALALVCALAAIEAAVALSSSTVAAASEIAADCSVVAAADSCAAACISSAGLGQRGRGGADAVDQAAQEPDE